MSGPLNFGAHDIEGWLPTVGRVRHITSLDTEPAPGVVVECLCGRDITISHMTKRHAWIYDCVFCFEVWCEQRPLAVPVQLSPQAAQTPSRGGQDLPPVAAGVPDPAATGLPREAAPCH